MKKPFLLWRFIASLCLLLTLCCSSIILAASHDREPKDLGGFTPNARVTLSFPASRYPVSSSPTADVSITGPVNGPHTVTIKNAATGSTVASITLTIGSSTASNKGSVAIPLPSTAGAVKFRASFGTAPNTATKDTTVTAVGVKEIQYNRNGTWVTVSSLSDVIQGSTFAYRAVSAPTGAAWPTGFPVWTGSGTPETAPSKSVTYSTTGSNTVTATCGNPKSVAASVVTNPKFDRKTATATKIKPATYRFPTVGTNVLGTADTEYSPSGEQLDVSISAYRDASKWYPIMTSLGGYYSLRAFMAGKRMEVPDPTATTEGLVSCAQATSLKALSAGSFVWFMESAIDAHEKVHGDHAQPAIIIKATDIESILEATTLSVPDTGQTKQQAIDAIKALPAWTTAVNQSFVEYDNQYFIEIAIDHGPLGVITATGPNIGPAYAAEIPIVTPKINTIKVWRAAQTPPKTNCTACGD